MVPFIVLVALVFNFMNGFNDAANSIATIVSTRVLRPRLAVLWAALFNFLAVLLATNVAATIGTGIVDPHMMTNLVVVAGLAGAILWDLIAWFYGLPVSSSHGLIGGLIGAAVVASGVRVLVWSGITQDPRVHGAVSADRIRAGVHVGGGRHVRCSNARFGTGRPVAASWNESLGSLSVL